MNNEITAALIARGAEIVRFVDISDLPRDQTLGLDNAIIFCTPLSREYIQKMHNTGFRIDYNTDEYLAKERQVEDIADWLADFIIAKGHRAHSQSSSNNKKCGYTERAYINPSMEEGISILPQKAIAHMAGLGFIGKNNLLVTKAYGCAVAICSVLTDAPVATQSCHIPAPQCGSCNACVKACPAQALSGSQWTSSGGREAVLDVSKCCCALKCMLYCPWTLKYANLPHESATP